MNFTIDNLLAYAIQVAIVIAAGALLPIAFHLRAPKPLLAYWHLLLLTCLALPFLQPWKSQAVLVLQDLPLRSSTTAPAATPATTAASWTLPEILIAILSAGAALRFLWLCAGFLKLRIYRRSARLLEPLPPEIRRLRARLASHAELLVSDRLTSPVTFGLWNPAVLLPAKFLEFTPEVREAIVCHELLHIARRDWIVAIAEELVRCLFWFHPAIWWLLGRIQLVREQVVDLAVIEHTNQPELYVDALLVIAASKLQADLAPAPLFLKKRHLRQRVAAIVQGVSMSKRLLIVSTFAVFAALPLVIGITAWQFPLNAAPQQVRDGIGVEVRSGPWTMLHRTGIAYPRDAREKHLSGEVIVSVSVDTRGEVTDARIISGPEEFRKAVLEAVLGWHFATSDWDLGNGVRKPIPPSFEVAIRFDASQLPPLQQKQQPPPATAADVQNTLSSVDVSALPPDMQARVLSLLPAPGARMGPGEMASVEPKLHTIDSHLTTTYHLSRDRDLRIVVTLPSAAYPVTIVSRGATGGVAGGVPGGVAGQVGSGVSGGVPGGVIETRGYAISRPASESPNPNEPRRIRVGGNVQASNLIQKITPPYPPLAKQARIQGTVRFEAIIGADGRIVNLQLVAGHPLLVQPATEAVAQWIYRPTLLNGMPVEVITQIDVNFTLSDSPPQATDQDLLKDRSRKAGQ